MDVQTVVRKVDEVLRDLLSVASEEGREVVRAPDVDVVENGDFITLFVDLPGFKKEGIKVRVFEDKVEVRAEPAPLNGALRRERISNFKAHRVVGLKHRVRPDTARAVYRDGVLQVIMQKISEFNEMELRID